MNKTKIEWVKNPDGSQGFTLNSKTGCLNHTPDGLCLGGMFPCYAFRLANGRLKSSYLANEEYAPVDISNLDVIDPADDPFYPRFWPKRLEQPNTIRKPASIFLDDMSDWMGSYWSREWTEMEIDTIEQNPQHRFYTLTKQPQNLIKFSPFPENCYVGVTATSLNMFLLAANHLQNIKAKVRFISLEPLLSWTDGRNWEWKRYLRGIDWVIIGSQTRPIVYPKIEWIKEIVKAADKAGIPVFLKDNLYPLLAPDMRFGSYKNTADFTARVFKLRQEMPTSWTG